MFWLPAAVTSTRNPGDRAGTGGEVAESSTSPTSGPASVSSVSVLPMIESMRENAAMPLAMASARFTLTAASRNEKSRVSMAATGLAARGSTALLSPPSSRPVSEAPAPMTWNVSAALPPIRFSMFA